MMPEGVEHATLNERPQPGASQVTDSMMPEGVEHRSYVVYRHGANAGDRFHDAGRR